MATRKGRFGPVALVDSTGNPRPDASVVVRLRGGDPTTVYPARTGGAAVASPLPTGVASGVAGIDAAGNMTVFVDLGSEYEYVATFGGVEQQPVVFAPWDDGGELALVRSQPVEGARLWVVAHSWGVSPGVASTAGQEWMARLARRTGLQAPTLLSQSGIRAEEMTVALWGNAAANGITSRTWAPNARGVVVLDVALNNMIQAADPPTAADLGGFTHALRTCLAVLSSGSRVEETAGTFSGTWNVSANGGNSGGAARWTDTPGAYVEHTVSSPTGEVWVPFLCVDPVAAPTSIGTYVVSIDGVTALTVDASLPANQMRDVGGVGDRGFFFALARLVLPDTAAHTVRITKGDGDTDIIWTDALVVPSATPPLVVVCQDPAVTSALAVTTANKPEYDAAIAAVVAEFDNAVVADLGAGFDRATMLGPDGGHPSDPGMHHVAGVLEEAIHAAVPTPLPAGIV